MKRKTFWWLNGLGALILLILAVVVLIRRTDGSGYPETIVTQSIALAIIAVIALVVIAVELIVTYIHKKHRQ
ncbi:DUF3923 family protein [Lapidilactobacillus wuchangensis]|uniref:DUF3923 family protein n=1 Tax=Lapidilactobacillus wuchangensis TaxID=2486001 RepID=UPI000F7AF40D|nr:DUF3923 family protein [Lapidilactobacillus wuchangensis]